MASGEPIEDFSDDLTDDEPWGRYIVEKKKSFTDERTVKPKLFLPAPKDHKTSGFRHKGLETNQIWALGKKHFLEPFNNNLRAQGRSPKTLLGRAYLKVGQIAATGLFIEPDNIPLRHAAIAGWPPEAENAKLISLAQRLAADATLHLIEDEE